MRGVFALSESPRDELGSSPGIRHLISDGTGSSPSAPLQRIRTCSKWEDGHIGVIAYWLETSYKYNLSEQFFFAYFKKINLAIERDEAIV